MKLLWGDFLGIGGIGIAYNNPVGAIITHVIIISILALACIGAVTAFKIITFGKEKKK